MPGPALLEAARPFGVPEAGETALLGGIELLRTRAKTVVEIAKGLSIYGDDPAEFEAKGLEKFGKPENAEILRALADRLDAVAPFAHAELEEAARALAVEKGMKLGDLAQPARLALTGSTASPPLFDVIALLGRETTRRRLRSFANRIAPRAEA